MQPITVLLLAAVVLNAVADAAPTVGTQMAAADGHQRTPRQTYGSTAYGNRYSAGLGTAALPVPVAPRLAAALAPALGAYGVGLDRYHRGLNGYGGALNAYDGAYGGYGSYGGYGTGLNGYGGALNGYGAGLNGYDGAYGAGLNGYDGGYGGYEGYGGYGLANGLSGYGGVVDPAVAPYAGVAV